MEKKDYTQPLIKAIELERVLFESASEEDNLDADAKKSFFNKEWEEE